MSDDVLTHWAHGIAEAEMMSDLPGGDPWADPMHCIRDLAAALRAEREQAAAAMSYFLDPNDPGSPPKYTEEYGPTLLNQIQGLAGYYEEMMDEDRAEVERLKARVAELEADAKLGRMVREMSEELGLYRNGPALSNLYADGRVWETIGQWGDLSEMSSERYSTPEAALEMARKEIP